MCIADMWVIIYESARVRNICYISVQGMVDVKVYFYISTDVVRERNPALMNKQLVFWSKLRHFGLYDDGPIRYFFRLQFSLTNTSLHAL